MSFIEIEETFHADPLGGSESKKYYKNRETGAEYRRIVGGTANPSGGKPGAAVVVAEDLREDVTFNARHYHVLAEYESMDIPQLLKRCADFQNAYKAKPFYGDSNNAAIVHFLSEFNRDRGSKGFHISDAPYVSDPHNLQLYANLIKTRWEPARRTLHLAEESKLPHYLAELSPEEVSKVKAQDWPAIAALGYAIATLSQGYFDVSEARKFHREHVELYTVEGI